MRRIVTAKAVVVLGWLTTTSCSPDEHLFEFEVSVRVEAEDVTLHAPTGTVLVAPGGLPFWIAKTQHPDLEAAREHGMLLETRRSGQLVDTRIQLARDCTWPDDGPALEGQQISSIVVDVDGIFSDGSSCTRCYAGDRNVETCP